MGPCWNQGRTIRLDEENALRPKPDLSWWRGRRCLFVGDAKYKLTEEGRLSDLYQLLAYCIATGLDSGLLTTPSSPRVRCNTNSCTAVPPCASRV